MPNRPILLLLPLLALAACGGGGDAPAPPPCVPVAQVKIQLFGDSTMHGAGSTNTPAGSPIYAPSVVIQAAMDTRFGAGAVRVYNNAALASSSAQLMAGTDGVNAPWPGSVLPDANIVLVAHGVLDQLQATPLATFRANVTAFASITGHKVVLQTPNPVYRSWANPAYAQVTREVAAATGTTLSDVYALLASQPNPASLSNDQVHPNDAGYQLLEQQVVLPTLTPLVAALKCQ